jgi:hypothetical protein
MDGDIQTKSEERLKKLIEKYGRRDIPLTNEDFLTSIGLDIDEEEDIDEVIQELHANGEVDMRPMQYYFHYDKIKNDSFKITADFDIEKSQTGKYETHILIYDLETVELIKELIEDPDLYSEPAFLSTAALYYAIHDLRTNYNNYDNKNELKKYQTDGIKRILDLTEEFFKDKYKKIDSMLEQGMIDFESLWYYLDHRNKIYVVKQFDHDICFRYKVFTYQTDIKEESLHLIGEIIQPTESELSICEYFFQIHKFTGTKKLDLLKIKQLDPVKKAEYLEVAHKVVEKTKGIHHMSICGKHYCVGQQDAIIACEKNERVIVDYEGMRKYSNPVVNFPTQKAVEMEHLTEDDYLIVFPMVPVYNLGIYKQWGITHATTLSPIKYKKDAFDYLVLDDNKKSIIKCLINNKRTDEEYGDFIDGKGDGLVFLLYGNPGTGKTFTAEATCEFLEKPLYPINIGDLGTDPENMENIMNIVLEYAKRWDAIVMMDEVDIFLEEREMSNIIRNAMVGVFLKILEYHDGIIFLTTNRLASLDPAVKSRVNLMISYHDLDTDRRKMIWEALFKRWNLHVDNHITNQLSKEQLNGREIRNYMKIVIAVHRENKWPLTGESILKIFHESLELTKEFTKSVGAPSSIYI